MFVFNFTKLSFLQHSLYCLGVKLIVNFACFILLPVFALQASLQSSLLLYFWRIDRIQRFSVIPLSTNSGLIGWVPHTDTLHSLIRDYREKKKILLNIEHRLMLRVSTVLKHCEPTLFPPTLFPNLPVLNWFMGNNFNDRVKRLVCSEKYLWP